MSGIDIVKVSEAGKPAANPRPVQQPAPAAPNPLVGAVSTEPKY